MYRASALLLRAKVDRGLSSSPLARVPRDSNHGPKPLFWMLRIQKLFSNPDPNGNIVVANFDFGWFDAGLVAGGLGD